MIDTQFIRDCSGKLDKWKADYYRARTLGAEFNPQDVIAAAKYLRSDTHPLPIDKPKFYIVNVKTYLGAEKK